MPTYSTPGVYVEDVPPLSRPIEGVSTSTAGFIGIAATFTPPDKMPINPQGNRFGPGVGNVTSARNVLTLTQVTLPVWATTDNLFVTLPGGRAYAASKKSPTVLTVTNGPSYPISGPIAISLTQSLKGKLAVDKSDAHQLIPTPALPTWITAAPNTADFRLTISGVEYLFKISGGNILVDNPPDGVKSPYDFEIARRQPFLWTASYDLAGQTLTLSPRNWPAWASPQCYVMLKSSPKTRAWVGSIKGGDSTSLELTGVVPKELQSLTSGDSNEVVLVDGYYRQAQANTAIQVTSWEQFKNNFGDFSQENEYLALPVYGFFNNGGTRCYVARIDPAAGDFTTNVQLCLDSFEPIDEISIVAAPFKDYENVRPQVHAMLITHCKLMNNRIAVLDCGEAAQPSDFSPLSPPSSPDGFAALYFPWLNVVNPLGADPPMVAVPPSGAIAGIYARVDAQRGVYKAPANEPIQGALGLTYPVSNNEQGPLNEIGVNCIRNFYGSNLVWGARTLASKPGGDAEWKYVNVRRFMIFLEESIQQSLRWVVFEPNDPGLWQRIKRTVNEFLLVQWRAGALFGETPKQAFFVLCDASTNPPELRELGQVVTMIGVAVVKPAEFVIFRIQQQTGG
jgi:Bacteriophage tail sheath protein